MGRTENLKGVTLLELLIAMTILVIVGLFSAPILYSSYRSFEASNSQMRLQNNLHLAMREIVDYMEASIPLPVSDSIGEESVKVVSTTKVELYNFVNPKSSDPNNPVDPADFEDQNNYTKTTIEYINGEITRKTSKRGKFSTIEVDHTLGVREQVKAGAPLPVYFVMPSSNRPIFEQGINKNDVIVTLEAETKTRYGTSERATLTVVATARSRRAGD